MEYICINAFSIYTPKVVVISRRYSVHLKTHTFKWRFFLWIWVAIQIYFTQCIFIHIIILINDNIDWFNVIWFALHISHKKTRFVRVHIMHEEIEQFYVLYFHGVKECVIKIQLRERVIIYYMWYIFLK